MSSSIHLPEAVKKKILNLQARKHQAILLQSEYYLRKAAAMFHHVVMHRQAGKTTGVIRSIQKTVWQIFKEREIFRIFKDVDSWMPKLAFLAETQKQARNLVWDELQVLLSTFRKVKFNNSSLQITIPRPHIGDNIQVWIMAIRNHNRVRGNKFRRIFIDEAQNLTSESFDKSIFATLSSCRGTGVTTGTARPYGFYREKLLTAFKEGMPVHVVTALATNVFDLNELIKFEKEMGYYAFQQEYMCNFNTPMKGAFFADRIHELEKLPHFYQAEFIVGAPTLLEADLGVGKGFACWVVQVNGEWKDQLDYFDDYETGTDLRRDIEAAGYTITDLAVPHDATTRRFDAYRATTMVDEFHKTWPDLPRPRPLQRPRNKGAQINSARENWASVRFPSKLAVGTDAHRGLNKLKNYGALVDIDGYVTDKIIKVHSHAADSFMHGMEFLNMRNGIIKRPLRGSLPSPERPRISRLSLNGSLLEVRRQMAKDRYGA